MFNFFLQKKGIITVFVTLLMVPVLAIAGIMVDVARMRLYDSQALFVADAYAEAVLTDYDHMLKQLYGIFAVTQDTDEKDILEKDYATFLAASFNPNLDGTYKGFMPYANANAEIKFSQISDANLSNNYVLETQIADFMKFRVIETMSEDFGWLDAMSQISSVSDAIDVIEERDRISEQSSESLKDMVKFFEDMQKIDSENYGKRFRLNGSDTGDAVKKNYSRQLLQFYNMLKGIADGENYKYCYEHKTENEDNEKIYKEFEKNNSPFKFANKSLMNMDFSDKQKEYDAAEAAYDFCYEYSQKKSLLTKEIMDKRSSGENLSSLKKDVNDVLYTAASSYREMQDLKVNIEDGIKELEERMAALKEKLDNLDESKPDVPEIKAKMKAEIADLEKIIQMKGKFMGTCYELSLMGLEHNFEDNKNKFIELADKLSTTYDALSEVMIDPEKFPVISELEEDHGLLSRNADKASWVKWSFWDKEGKSDTAGPFYRSLKEVCKTNGKKSEEDKDVEKNIKEKAQKEQEKVEAEVDEKEDKNLRDLSEDWSKYLDSTSKNGKTDTFLGYFHGNSFADKIKNIGSNLVDRALVVSYDFNMFTCRVTNVEKKSDKSANGSTPAGETEKKEAECSLTDIPYSKDVNYLYGAELEYLLGGHYKSIDNLKETRNQILAVREAMNFASTYTIKEINNTINGIANAAAEVAAATPAAPFAPLIRVAVSGTLRLTVSGIRSAEDWKNLKAREDVIFYNQDVKDYVDGTSIKSFFENVNTDTGADINDFSKGTGANNGKLKLSYEDYVRILLLLQSSTDTLNRTGNLIMLNVNQALLTTKPDSFKMKANPVDKKAELYNTTDLVFLKKNAFTAIQSSCLVKMDFLVLPDSVADFIFASSDKDYFDAIDGRYYGYTLSRGY